MAYYSRNRLYKTNRGKLIGGVCAGLSEYFKMDVSMIRIIFVVLGFVYGATIWLYILLWLFLPTDFSEYRRDHWDNPDEQRSTWNPGPDTNGRPWDENASKRPWDED